MCSLYGSLLSINSTAICCLKKWRSILSIVTISNGFRYSMPDGNQFNISGGNFFQHSDVIYCFGWMLHYWLSFSRHKNAHTRTIDISLSRRYRSENLHEDFTYIVSETPGRYWVYFVKNMDKLLITKCVAIRDYRQKIQSSGKKKDSLL